MAARATESGPAETGGTGTTCPSLWAELDCDELPMEVPLAVRSYVKVSQFRLKVGVDADVRECEA